MSTRYPVAKQETADQILEQLQNSGSIAHPIWLLDYKQYGTASYVYRDKDKLHELYRDYAISMNDESINGAALDYADSIGEAGLALAAAYGADTVIVSEPTMAAIAASEVAMTAVIASETAMTAVAASEVAMTAVAASEVAMTAVAASEVAMTAVIASETAMTAVAASEVAMTAVIASETAMTAVIASETAMTAVIASETAMTAVAASETAMTAVIASETAMTAVIASETAMTAVIASETAMTAVAASVVALNAICKNNSASDRIKTVIQSYYSQIYATLGTANSDYFTYTTYAYGYSGLSNLGAASYNETSATFTKTQLKSGNTILLPYSDYDDGDSAQYLFYGTDNSKQIYSSSAHRGTNTISSAVSFRGIYMTFTGSSIGGIAFRVYTAK